MLRVSLNKIFPSFQSQKLVCQICNAILNKMLCVSLVCVYIWGEYVCVCVMCMFMYVGWWCVYVECVGGGE